MLSKININEMGYARLSKASSYSSKPQKIKWSDKLWSSIFGKPIYTTGRFLDLRKRAVSKIASFVPECEIVNDNTLFFELSANELM